MSDPPANAGRARGALVEAAAIGGGALAIAVALIWWAAGGREAGPPTSRQAGPSPEAAGPLRDLLVGDRACAECHPGEHALHARSGHARTLRPAVESSLARELAGTTVEDPEQPGVSWSFAL